MGRSATFNWLIVVVMMAISPVTAYGEPPTGITLQAGEHWKSNMVLAQLASPAVQSTVNSEGRDIVSGQVALGGGVTAMWQGQGAGASDLSAEVTGGFKYCKMGTGYDGHYNITGERYAFACSASVVLGGHYDTLYKSRWCGNGWYMPDGNGYYQSTMSIQIPDPRSYGYQFWAWYNVVFAYTPMPTNMQQEEGNWLAIWFDEDTAACQHTFTVAYDTTDHTVCKRISTPGNDALERTDRFAATDSACFAWVRLDHFGVNQAGDVEFKWINPSGHVFEITFVDISNPVSQPNGYWDSVKVYSSLPIANDSAAKLPGTWQAKVFVRDCLGIYEQRFSETFRILCCEGKTGNVNMIAAVDLADLSALVNYLTMGSFTPPCMDAANVNGAGGVDLSDLSALVSYLTGGSFVLPNCP